jgi:hypothetical protein
VQDTSASVALNIFAAVLVLAAFLLYNRGSGKISTGTWFILATSDLLDFGSYFEMTGHDLAKNAVPLCFAVGSVLTFLYALKRGRFACPDKTDIAIVALDLLILWAWLDSETVTSVEANLAYQATTILAFVPMYRGLAKGTEQETVAPWALWTAAFGFFLLAHVLALAPWQEGVFPFVGLLTHAAVLAFPLRKIIKNWRNASPAL